MGCCFESDRLFSFLSTVLLLIVLYGGRATNAQPQPQPQGPQPIYAYHFCLGGNYTAKSTFQSNLNLLLPSLSSFNIKLAVGKGDYYNQTVGQNPDTVFGSVQCRGNLTVERCRDCVDRVAQEITRSDRCPESKQAIIWYDDCMLRYSDKYFFSIMESSPTVYMWNPNNVNNNDQFNRKLGVLMNDLSREAASESSDTSLFATGKANVKESQDIYGLVQCTFDISKDNCNRCLRNSIAQIPRCCAGKQGGRVIQPSCYIRYEIDPFYDTKVTAAEPAPLPSQETPIIEPERKKSSTIVIIIVVLTVITVLSTIIIGYFYLQKRKATRQIDDDVDEIQNAESLQFNFNTIRVATDDFSDANKLGQGGFGSVYKGTLLDGQDIAVKRLSRNSGQGEQEFKNEVELVVKLQHRNLVRLLGFSIRGEERLLIYECMPNGSLDQFIFDPVKRTYLDWERRYKIIEGIARGLLYLHEDSRLRIIHRDLKASNVLLEEDMNPKIADFGMARMFTVNQTQASTNRIVGTYGYMAPEYAMHGHFSVKSDVFSFGILVLEILSGKKNNSFYGSEGAQDLLSNAWRHWKEDTALELLDPTLRECYSRMEVMRCIQIGLLCVQEDVDDRPTMASIVNKLNNYSVTLQSPTSPPSYFVHNRKQHMIIPLEENDNFTENEASITELLPR